MGLSHFPTASEGVLPLLVMNTVISVSLLKNMVRSVLHVDDSENDDSRETEEDPDENSARRRRISITQFKSLQQSREEEEEEESGSSESGSGESRNNNKQTEGVAVECCVCLCGFKEEEEVSELLSCKHFFHRSCLDKWFGNNEHTTCPLCRSIF